MKYLIIHYAEWCVLDLQYAQKHAEKVQKLVYHICLYLVMNLYAVEVHMKILRGHYFVQIFIAFWQEEIVGEVTSEKCHD